jgi:hypothetical protein
VIFFFASAGASAGEGLGDGEEHSDGWARTKLYSSLIGTGNDPNKLFVGYLIGAGAMILGGVVEIIFGVASEGKSLEDVANPLSVVSKAVGSASSATRSAPPVRGEPT